MLRYEYIPHIATSVFVLLMTALIIYLIRIALREKEDDNNFDKQLDYNINPLKEEKVEESSVVRKLKFLPNLMIKSGLVEKGADVEELQKKIILVATLLFTITTFISRKILVGFLPILFAYVGVVIMALFKINKVKSLMDEQIPSFISTFKANIQAGQHAQNAMISAIDNTASPLYDELSYPKAIMEAGDFRPGIIALRRNTDNETLRQMATCIELASTSGSNIESQIVIIEEIIADKQLLARKKKLGVNENKSLFIVAALVVPVSFIGSFFMSEMHRDFWFNSTLSWIIFFAVVFAAAISTYATWKVIQKVEIG